MKVALLQLVGKLPKVAAALARLTVPGQITERAAFDENSAKKGVDSSMALCITLHDDFGRADEFIVLHASLESVVAVTWRGIDPTLAASVRAGHGKKLR